MKNPVVIVGAGLSGLRAASLLTAQGVECKVMEVRGRIGGRVLSILDPNRPDLGTLGQLVATILILHIFFNRLLDCTRVEVDPSLICPKKDGMDGGINHVCLFSQC